MRKLISIALVMVFAFSAVSLFSEEGATDGKAIFEANKCMNCHSISSLEIEGKMNKADLSKINDELKDKDALASFLKKEKEVNGKKHMMPFKGTDEELAALAEWLINIQPVE